MLSKFMSPFCGTEQIFCLCGLLFKVLCLSVLKQVSAYAVILCSFKLCSIIDNDEKLKGEYLAFRLQCWRISSSEFQMFIDDLLLCAISCVLAKISHLFHNGVSRGVLMNQDCN
jgi:hypothetical protein